MAEEGCGEENGLDGGQAPVRVCTHFIAAWIRCDEAVRDSNQRRQRARDPIHQNVQSAPYTIDTGNARCLGGLQREGGEALTRGMKKNRGEERSERACLPNGDEVEIRAMSKRSNGALIGSFLFVENDFVEHRFF